MNWRGCKLYCYPDCWCGYGESRGWRKLRAILIACVLVPTLLLCAFCASVFAQEPIKPTLDPAKFEYVGRVLLSSTQGISAIGDYPFGKGLALEEAPDGLYVLTGSWKPANMILRWKLPWDGQKLTAWQTSDVKSLGTVPSTVEIFGLYWDHPTKTLWAGSTHTYPGPSTTTRTLSRSVIDPVAGKLKGLSFFTFANRSYKTTGGTVTPLPEWFQKLSGCGPLAATSGGYFSVDSFGPNSRGPALTCFTPPDETYDDSIPLRNTSLLNYPLSNVVGTPAAWRNSDYMQHLNWGWWPEKVPATEHGWFTPGDEVGQGCVFLDLPGAAAVACVPYISEGCIWYGDNTGTLTEIRLNDGTLCSSTTGKAAALNSHRARHWLYLYAPADLAKVARKQRAENDVQAYSMTPLDLPGIVQPVGGKPQAPTHVVGIAYLASQRLFAVSFRSDTQKKPWVYFWRVKDGSDPTVETRTPPQAATKVSVRRVVQQ